MSLKIGNVELEHGVMLAPMAGVTDLPFRILCHEQGSALQFMEMVSAKAILYKNKNTQPLLEVSPEEGKTAIQLFGSDPAIMGAIAGELDEGPYSMVDINMGCPVPKIVNNGEGSALMKNSDLAEKIIKSVVKNVTKPVTVKFRKGFDETTINAVSFAKMVEQAGASAITVHGRTREQYYSGEADWDIIRQVKEAVSIPVIASGDIFTPKNAKECFLQTGCDGIVLARGVRGNPWLFREVISFLETGEIIDKPSNGEIRNMILRHSKMLVAYKGEYIGIREMRKHVSWYLTGMPYAAKMRLLVNEVESIEEMEQLLEKIVE